MVRRVITRTRQAIARSTANHVGKREAGDGATTARRVKRHNKAARIGGKVMNPIFIVQLCP